VSLKSFKLSRDVDLHPAEMRGKFSMLAFNDAEKLQIDPLMSTQNSDIQRKTAPKGVFLFHEENIRRAHDGKCPAGSEH